MIIYLDIETIPAQNPQVRADILANIAPPATYKKPESIAEWMAANAEAEAEKEWLKTSFDGASGHIICIGYAFDNEPAQTLYCSLDQIKEGEEGNMLREFMRLLSEHVGVEVAHSGHRVNEPVTFVGHNLIDFDLRFLLHRCMVNQARPAKFIPFNAKSWDATVYDTMTQWSGVKSRISLDRLSKALGLEGKGSITGADVWPMVRDGKFHEVADYCAHDVELTRAVYKRMTFSGV